MGNTSSTEAAVLDPFNSSKDKRTADSPCIDPRRLVLGPNEVQGLPVKPFGDGPGGDANPYAVGKKESREIWRKYFNGNDADL
ncbi:hypothetical protein Rhopal_001837-T1 [Rhodotorula paludigena]|uniref:Uncharacterized protein n=1 Tax=Rhodotorula paludigena TaxID=86838 RepID=A0AAV5G8F4_9BASI|nr:hypothetical protein Rhopal_001837-T1 [Rhodotorula paludigena]